MGETTKAVTLLLTRPQAQSEEFLDRLTTALGHRPRALIAPLAAFVPTGAAIPEGAAILTSGRAVEAAGPALAGRTAYCVGARTAALAQAAGAAAVSADGDAEALLALVLALRPRRAVHLRGAEATGDLAARLTAGGVPTADVILYRSVPVDPPPALAALLASGTPVLAPVFSPRSAARLAEVAGDAVGRVTVVAISAAAAAPLAGAARVAVADRPDAATMATLVLRLRADLP
jgi:uroporphyrinogen-III synthase